MADSLPSPASALEELAATLQLSSGSALTFALAPDLTRASAAAALNRRLKDLLPPSGPGETPLREVRLSPDPAALLRLVETLPAEPRTRALHVFGLEGLPAESRAATLRALNFYRDRLRESRAGFVFWVTPSALSEVPLFAPDLWSVRGGVFDLSAVPLDPLAQLRAGYLAHLRRAHRALDLKLPQLENFTRELLLEEVFVPLLARPELPAGETWERRLAGRGFEAGQLEAAIGGAAAQSSAPAPIEQALAEKARVVILGDPGSGKTSLLKHLALRLAAGLPANRTGARPAGPLAAGGEPHRRAGPGEAVAGLADRLLRRGGAPAAARRGPPIRPRFSGRRAPVFQPAHRARRRALRVHAPHLRRTSRRARAGAVGAVAAGRKPGRHPPPRGRPRLARDPFAGGGRVGAGARAAARGRGGGPRAAANGAGGRAAGGGLSGGRGGNRAGPRRDRGHHRRPAGCQPRPLPAPGRPARRRLHPGPGRLAPARPRRLHPHPRRAVSVRRRGTPARHRAAVCDCEVPGDQPAIRPLCGGRRLRAAAVLERGRLGVAHGRIR